MGFDLVHGADVLVDNCRKRMRSLPWGGAMDTLNVHSQTDTQMHPNQTTSCEGDHPQGLSTSTRFNLSALLMGRSWVMPALLAGACLLSAQAGAAPTTERDLPVEFADDAVMASPQEVRQLHDWVAKSFGLAKSSGGADRIGLEVRRQDYNVLRFGQSCMETPLRIGSKSFQHGLGTHAQSEIVVAIPKGAITFKCFVGVDNNYDTRGTSGSVQFSVGFDGTQVYQSGVRTGADEPVPVDIDVPWGAREMLLKVTDGGNGPACDQADWADAKFKINGGKDRWLDVNQSNGFLQDGGAPFSFVYGGASSADLLKVWKRSVETRDLPDRVEQDIRWQDPKTGLSVTAVVKSFKRYPAVDWLLYFENGGEQDSPILENVQTADFSLTTGAARNVGSLHQLRGDSCGEESFTPFTTSLPSPKRIRLAPTAGRPSAVSAFPFFDLEYEGKGFVAAVGWSGQWAASFDRTERGPTRFQVGMERTHLVLHPGEKIRTPRVLVMPWQGERGLALNRFRRLMLFHYVPQNQGKPVLLPVALQCFDRYVGTRKEWATEAGQIAAVRSGKELGVDTHWLDAAWFPVGFPNGVGSWYADPKSFPNGLKPVSDECHRMGMKFVLWFEPERVAAGSQLAREHPEFVMGGEKGGLFKLNDPAARRHLTDLLSKRISEYGIDIYRNDFNIDPLGFWQQADSADRQGMTEIRYVEGHYAMWDELLARHKGLVIDSCASGGRRIDLETCSRSVPLWRSDTSCSPGHPEWNQLQTAGLSQYIPLHTACVWIPEAYDVRSAGTGGLIAQMDYLDPKFPKSAAAAMIAEIRENQKYHYGDFYPLSSPSISPDQFVAYQFHRPDLNAGIVLGFRHAQCGFVGVTVGLHGLNPKEKYMVEVIDDKLVTVRRKATGRELLDGLDIRTGKPGSSVVVRYRPIGT